MTIDAELRKRVQDRLNGDYVPDGRPGIRRSVARALAAEGVVLAPQAWARLVKELVDDIDGGRLAREVSEIRSESVFGMVAEALADAAEAIERME